MLTSQATRTLQAVPVLEALQGRGYFANDILCQGRA